MVKRSPHQLALPGFKSTVNTPVSKNRSFFKSSVSVDTSIPAHTQKVTLQGRTISYTVRYSLIARMVRLEIKPEAGLTVVVPFSCSMDRVQRFIESKSHWILAKLIYYGLVKHRRTSRLKDGDTIPYLGRSLQIVVRDCNGKGESVTLSREKLIVAVRSGTSGLNPILERWYRTQAAEMLNEKVDKQSSYMGVTYHRIYLKGQKTLWGSCSRKRNLNFNWRLLMTPEPIIDYVVVHELAHLKEMNHTRRFWQVVTEYCPGWKQHRKWLREHSTELNRILRI